MLFEAIAETTHNGLQFGPFGICSLFGTLEIVIKSFYLLTFLDGEGDKLLFFGDEGLPFIFEETFHIFLLEFGQ